MATQTSTAINLVAPMESINPGPGYPCAPANNKNSTTAMNNKGKLTMLSMPTMPSTMQNLKDSPPQSIRPIQSAQPLPIQQHSSISQASQVVQASQAAQVSQIDPLKNTAQQVQLQQQHQQQHQQLQIHQHDANVTSNRQSNPAQQGPSIAPQLQSRPLIQQTPQSQQPVQSQVQQSFQSPYLAASGLPIQSPYGTVAQDAAYYASHPSPRSAHSAVGTFTSAGPDLMAAAQMSRSYPPPIYHTPQSNSPASVASPQNHEHRMYAAPAPQMAPQIYGYAQYPPPMPPVHPAPYGQPQSQQTHSPMTGQPLLMQQPPTQMPQQQQQQQQPQPSQSLQQPPQSQPQQPQTQQTTHQTVMTNSPRMKLEPSIPQRPSSGPLGTSQTSTSATASNSNLHASPPGNGGINPNAAPGPIPATTPLVVRQDNNGVQWIAFEYSRDRVKMEYTIRCDVESINVESLTEEFKTENCVYPRACCRKDQYRGNRLVYETECNTVGWALAELNPCLRGKRGLIQRAVDSWRNSNQDPRLRSRRVRRMAKMNTRKAVVGNGVQTPVTAASTSITTGSVTPQSVRTTGVMGMPAPQLHHHHAHPEGSILVHNDDVSGAPNDVRQGRIFQGGYSNYPNNSTIVASIPPTMHDGIPMGREIPNSNNTVATSIPSNKNDDPTDNRVALFGGLPEAKRRKFIIVDDTQNSRRVRVRVTLDQINMNDIPDSFRQANAVYPRSYFPMQIQSPPPSADGARFFQGDEDDSDDQPTKGRTLVPVPMLEGTEGEIAIPKITKRQRRKEVLLNDMGFRMSWGQGRVFANRPLFLQRSLDLYRNKMRGTILGNGQDVTTVAPHFETRVGKRRWQERTRRSEHARAP